MYTLRLRYKEPVLFCPPDSVPTACRRAPLAAPALLALTTTFWGLDAFPKNPIAYAFSAYRRKGLKPPVNTCSRI
jgi:hypothetical protein